MVTTIADLSTQLHDLELKEEEVLRDLARFGSSEQTREAEYTHAWVEMLFSILRYLSQNDKQELKRLASARRWFYESMAEAASKPGVRIVHWKRALAARLAYVLPPEMGDKAPITVWDPWVEEVS